MRLGRDAEVLRGQQRIGRGVQKPGEVVVGRIGVALLAPHREAVHVGADGHHARRLADHRLVEMAGRKPLAQRGIAGHHQRIELHVAARRGARCRFETFAEHLLGNRLRTELTDRTMLEKHTFHGPVSFRISRWTNAPPRHERARRIFSAKLAKLLEVLLFLP